MAMASNVRVDIAFVVLLLFSSTIYAHTCVSAATCTSHAFLARLSFSQRIHSPFTSNIFHLGNKKIPARTTTDRWIRGGFTTCTHIRCRCYHRSCLFHPSLVVSPYCFTTWGYMQLILQQAGQTEKLRANPSIKQHRCLMQFANSL